MPNNSVAALFTLAKTNNKKNTLANYVPCQMLVHLRKCLNKSLATAQQFMVSNSLHGNPFLFSIMQLSKSGVAAPLKSILPCGKTAENDVTLSKEGQIHDNNLTNKKAGCCTCQHYMSTPEPALDHCIILPWLIILPECHCTRAGTQSSHHHPIAHHPAIFVRYALSNALFILLSSAFDLVPLHFQFFLWHFISLLTILLPVPFFFQRKL